MKTKTLLIGGFGLLFLVFLLLFSFSGVLSTLPSFSSETFSQTQKLQIGALATAGLNVLGFASPTAFFVFSPKLFTNFLTHALTFGGGVLLAYALSDRLSKSRSLLSLYETPKTQEGSGVDEPSLESFYVWWLTVGAYMILILFDYLAIVSSILSWGCKCEGCKRGQKNAQEVIAFRWCMNQGGRWDRKGSVCCVIVLVVLSFNRVVEGILDVQSAKNSFFFALSNFLVSFSIGSFFISIFFARLWRTLFPPSRPPSFLMLSLEPSSFPPSLSSKEKLGSLFLCFIFCFSSFLGTTISPFFEVNSSIIQSDPYVSNSSFTSSFPSPSSFPPILFFNGVITAISGGVCLFLSTIKILRKEFHMPVTLKQFLFKFCEFGVGAFLGGLCSAKNF